MGTINVMAGHLGHGVIDTNGKAMTTEEIIEKLGSAETGRSISTDAESSKAIFDKMLGDGFIASKRVGPGEHEKITEYDAEAEITFRPQNIGG